MIPLEDNYLDIIKKACVGHGLGEKKLAQLAKVSNHKIRQFFKGNYCESTLQTVSQILNLDFLALKNHAQNKTHPPEIELSELQTYQTEFTYRPEQTLTVNHFLLSDESSQTALLFDTGTDATQSLAFLESKNLILTAIFITHQHRDHIAALNHYTNRFPTTKIFAAQNSNDPQYSFISLQSGAVQTLGSYRIESLASPGHSEDGISFKVTGCSRSVMFVGDALFAHSQGGIYSRELYQQALKANRSSILSQSDDTILAPGHGPLTTVGHEKMHNPFYANNPSSSH